MRTAFLLLTLLLSGATLAATPSDRPPEMKPVPDGPPRPGDAADIVIKPGALGQVIEYRANGKLFMLKIIPRVGRPYYLIDQKGDGVFARRDSLDSGLSPPMWVIKEF